MVKFENIVREKRLENLLTTFLVKKKNTFCFGWDKLMVDLPN